MQDKTDFIVKDGHKFYSTTCNLCSIFISYQRLNKSKTGLCRVCFGKSLKGKKVSQESRVKMKSSHYLKNGGTHPLLNKKHKPETLIKLSVAAAKQNANYKPNFIYNGIQMRSSWEARYAAWLDSKGIKWTYEVSFKLKSGKVYLADFVLENGEVVEIKGYFREDARLKWEQFCREHSELKKSLLGKEELKALGII